MAIIFWLGYTFLPRAEFMRRERAYYCGNGFRFLGRSWGIPS